MEALKQGFSVVANDISAKHLQIIADTAPFPHIERLSCVKGAFPNEVTFLKKSLGAVYACGVLHYLSPEKFVESLQKIYDALDDKGLVCIVTTSPYLKGYKAFLPTYEKRSQNGDLWPGSVLNYHDFFISKNFTNPKPANIMDCRILERSLKDANFEIIDLDYLSIKNVYNEQYNCGKELSAILAMKK